MPRSRLAAASLAVALLGVAAVAPKFAPGATPGRGEATTTLAALSLATEHDFRYEAPDRTRADRLWQDGPVGLRLARRSDGSLRFATPVLYPLAAAPWAALFGARGLLLLNAVLLLGASVLAARLRPQSRLASGFFLASGALALAFRLDASLFAMALVFAALALWWGSAEETATARLAWAGALAGAAASLTLAALWPAAVIVGDLGWRRRGRALVACLVAGSASAALAAGLQHRLVDEWWPGAAPTVLEGHAAESGSGSPLPPNSPRRGLETNPRWIGREILYRVFGRHLGAVPFFPLAVLGLVSGLWARDRRSRLMVAALLAGLVVGAAWRDGGDPAAFAWFAPLAPLAFFLLPDVPGPRSVVLAAAALGLWTAPAIAAAWASPGREIEAGDRLASFQALPLELTRLGPTDSWPGLANQAWQDAVWVVPRENVFVDEHHPHGSWVRGASRSELVLASPRAIPELALRLYAIAEGCEVTLEGAGGSAAVRFDSPAKRDSGVDVRLALRPVARDLGAFFPREFLYRVELTTSDGIVPRRRHPRGDPRNLGVFLSVDGQPP